MRIQTLPVYSKLADETEVRNLGLWDKLPVNADGTRWRLSQHQVETYQALTDPHGPDVVFNTAMTGDGKSLAAYLPALVDSKSVLAMYPTNELIRDQYEQLTSYAGYSSRFNRSDIRIELMYSDILDELQSTRGIPRRGDAILNLRQNNDLVLSNPDIFHYVMYLCYLRKKIDTPDKYFSRLRDYSDLLLFDEFHVFQAPQVAAVVNALLLMHFTIAQKRRRQYLFLSATPNEQLVTALRSAGLRCHEVNRYIDQPYLHVDAADPVLWRKILNQTDIHFEAGRAEEWVKQHLEDVIASFFEQYPNSKGTIIVNSVASAKRIVPVLRSYFASSQAITRFGRQLQVGENTGFSSQNEKQQSRKADLIVGTSTIDVGVDFKINFLIFESVDAGTFLQRLGRLGRHDGYEQDGKKYRFDTFIAYALVPDFILDRLSKGWNNKVYFQEGQASDRETLREAIVAVYPPVNSFEQYGKLWGALQSAYIINQLSATPVNETYAPIRESLARAYERAFGLKSINDKAKHLHKICKERRLLFDEIRSFRGGGDFDCGVIDESEPDSTDRMKTYNLFSLLANTDADLIEKAEFVRTVKSYNIAENRFDQDRLLFCFRMTRWLEEREDCMVRVEHDLGDCRDNWFGQARVLDGIALDIPSRTDINKINLHLAGKPFVCLLVKGVEPKTLKAHLQLPQLFGILPFRSVGSETGSIVFGKEALLLESALRTWRGKSLPKELCFIF